MIILFQQNGIDLQCLHYSRAAILHQKKAAGSRNRRIDLRAQFGRASSRVLASEPPIRRFFSEIENWRLSGAA
jgi:hypothetical protein